MELLSKASPAECRCSLVNPQAIDPEITEWDEAAFLRIVSTELSQVERERILTPPRTYPQQEQVLAVHWHPEYVPMELILGRVATLYPNCSKSLIIPTQHNILLEHDGFCGVEVDCYSHGFNRKVQLLVHLSAAKAGQATTLKAMLKHTFKYRTSQLFEYMAAVVEPRHEAKLQEAASQSNTDEDIVALCRIYVAKLSRLLERHWLLTNPESVKNKLVRNFFDIMREQYDDRIINKAQVFLKAVKEIVKRDFSLSYFYRASEIIEEVRHLGAGVVIPHPEQFWPILLADYDVDGIEVWNPQSREYTEFLIQAVERQNRLRGDRREVLIFMGDDCHMSEKLKDPAQQDAEKAAREIGLQPAWDDLAISKSLIIHGISRDRVIDEYRARLA